MVSYGSSFFLVSALLLGESLGIAQSYSIQTIAGTTVIKDGIPAPTAFLREPVAVVSDAAGNVYVADRSDHRVRKIGRDGSITTIAGTGVGGHAGDSGPAVQAQLNGPSALAIDKNNNLYIAEYLGNVVRKLDLVSGFITTVAGNGRTKASPGDGPKATQIAMDPEGIALDSKGNLLISDGANNRLRKVAPDGTASIIAGSGPCGSGGDNGSATAAQVCFPTVLGVDGADNIYFVDYAASRVRKIDPKGTITAFLGDGYPLSDLDGFPPLSTSVAYPDGLAVDAAGNVYVSESNRIRYVAAAGGNVRSVAGNGTLGFAGDKGAALAAKMAFPSGIFAFSNGDMLLADTGNFRVRRVTGGTIDTIAGTSINDGLTALSSLFNGPHGLAEDASGNIFIADTYNHRIRKLTTVTGTVTTIVGTGTAGSLEGRINSPDDVAIDSKGLLYFSDTANNRIMQIQPDGTARIFAGTGADGYTGDGSFAKNARLSLPRALVFDKADTLYFSDYGNARVRKVTADGLIQLVGGNGSAQFSGDGGNAKSAGMNPRGLAVDSDGTLYVSDFGNSRVRRIDPASGIISTVAGNGNFGNAGDGGKANDAYLGLPYGLALDGNRNLLISDYYTSVIRRVNLTTGTITTVAGSGKSSFTTESGAATLTNFDPTKMLVEKNGTILVADSLNDRVRRLTPLVAKTLSVVSGDKGSGVAGTSLALAVKVADASGYPIQGQAVSFSVPGGGATIPNPNVTSGVDGVATAQVTLGATLGAVTVRADSTGLTSVTFNLTVTAPVVVAPVITSVVGAAQSVPPVTTVSKNGMVQILLQGDSSGPGTIGDKRPAGPPPPPPIPFPTVFNGFCATVGGVAAPVYDAYAGTVAVVVPDVPIGKADVVVTSNCQTANQVASLPFSVTVAAASPEFNYGLRTADGKFYITAPGTPDVPVHPGDSLSISALGLGATSPIEPIGDVPVDMAPVTGTVTVTLGGNPMTPDFVGLVPGDRPGTYRVNLTLPADAPLGDQPITIQIGEAVSPTALINIAAPVSQLSRDSRKIEKDEIRQPVRRPRQ